MNEPRSFSTSRCYIRWLDGDYQKTNVDSEYFVENSPQDTLKSDLGFKSNKKFLFIIHINMELSELEKGIKVGWDRILS